MLISSPRLNGMFYSGVSFSNDASDNHYHYLSISKRTYNVNVFSEKSSQLAENVKKE
ncbi:hypothetical protein ANABIO32_44600 [Rossellomorea marisflavi]|nr:hypothetical protein ANABIO32_44600 [Rossellomorea marisflavi]